MSTQNRCSPATFLIETESWDFAGIELTTSGQQSRALTNWASFTSSRILSRVWKLATLLLVLRYYEHLFLISILKLHVTSSRFGIYLLNIYHFAYTFSHTHTEAHTHKHTCTIRTQEEWRQPGRRTWLRGVEERLC